MKINHFVDKIASKEFDFRYGVLQGSILVPVLLTSFILTMSSNIRQTSMPYHQYSDDSQISVETQWHKSKLAMSNIISKSEDFIMKIKAWMYSTKLTS